jgi:hypothetical protein
VSKLHTLKCAAYNLGLLLRKVWGYCKPRNAKTGAAAAFFAAWVLVMVATLVYENINLPADGSRGQSGLLLVAAIALICFRFTFSFWKRSRFLTGC